MTKAELIARLEGATGPSRVLDREIAEALAISPLHALRGKINLSWPDFTASIDAALTLVPAGWGWADIEIAPKAAEALLNNQKKQVRGKASTPALAIVIAALKAHAHD